MASPTLDVSLHQETDRRTFLRAAALVALAPAWGSARFSGNAWAADQQTAALIPRQKDPENLEFPFASLNGFLTPNELFYVRNHYAAPVLDPKTWRLEVTGAVRRPLRLTYAQVKDMGAQTLTATLECSGNGRAFLDPKAKGVQWQLGAVSTAEWTGVPLAVVLDQAGVRDGAVEVILEGADKGEPGNEPKPVGPIHFARSLPLAKARKPEVILAHRMNGAELPAPHGFPLRAVVAGWYGMASIKWLTRIVVTDRPFRGYAQTTDYTIWTRPDGLPSLTPITVNDVKASIARPSAGETVSANAPYRVHGAAWAGEVEVAKVEVSTDGGTTWNAARLLGEPVPFAWRLWEYNWRTPANGKHNLLARASDKSGRVQPLKRDPDRRNYLINHVVPVAVTVGG
jgi:DMSO/TMAO reductase YedYZ molybdopterin-dependent catalytic subunit